MMGEAPSQVDAALQQHAHFFDQLVDLIPAKYYHADTSDRVDLQSMKKAARLALKQEFKAKAKENKRSKLDPDAPGTALEVQQQQLAAKDAAAAEGAGGTAGGAARHLTLNPAGASLSREELKAKLQRKIEAIQQQRNAKEKQAVAQQAKEWRQKTLENNAKQKQKQGEQQKQKEAGSKRQAEEQLEEQQPAAKKQAKQNKQQQAPAKSAPQQADDQFQFARLEFNDNKSHGPGGRHKKPTKEQLLKAAEAKQAALAAAGATQEGKVLAVQDAWQTALARAEGHKVLDDPKLLRRSLKKEAKRKAKSAAAWQERKQSQKEQQDRKQQKRQDNLQVRADKKLATKKERREKKLLRAGFEGRKAGFIGDKPAPAAAGKSPAAAGKQ